MAEGNKQFDLQLDAFEIGFIQGSLYGQSKNEEHADWIVTANKIVEKIQKQFVSQAGPR